MVTLARCPRPGRAARGEVDDVRYVREDVVGDDQVGLPWSAAILAPVSAPRKVTSVGMPLASAASATLAAGSTPSDRMPERDSVLKEVAVVACDLDDERIGTEAKAVDRRIDEPPRVLHPGVGVRREVGVVMKISSGVI